MRFEVLNYINNETPLINFNSEGIADLNYETNFRVEANGEKNKNCVSQESNSLVLCLSLYDESNETIFGKIEHNFFSKQYEHNALNIEYKEFEKQANQKLKNNPTIKLFFAFRILDKLELRGSKTQINNLLDDTFLKKEILKYKDNSNKNVNNKNTKNKKNENENENKNENEKEKENENKNEISLNNFNITNYLNYQFQSTKTTNINNKEHIQKKFEEFDQEIENLGELKKQNNKAFEEKQKQMINKLNKEKSILSLNMKQEMEKLQHHNERLTEQLNKIHKSNQLNKKKKHTKDFKWIGIQRQYQDKIKKRRDQYHEKRKEWYRNQKKIFTILETNNESKTRKLRRGLANADKMSKIEKSQLIEFLSRVREIWTKEMKRIAIKKKENKDCHSNELVDFEKESGKHDKEFQIEKEKLNRTTGKLSDLIKNKNQLKIECLSILNDKYEEIIKQKNSVQIFEKQNLINQLNLDYNLIVKKKNKIETEIKNLNEKFQNEEEMTLTFEINQRKIKLKTQIFNIRKSVLKNITIIINIIKGQEKIDEDLKNKIEKLYQSSIAFYNSQLIKSKKKLKLILIKKKQKKLAIMKEFDEIKTSTESNRQTLDFLKDELKLQELSLNELKETREKKKSYLIQKLKVEHEEIQEKLNNLKKKKHSISLIEQKHLESITGEKQEINRSKTQLINIIQNLKFHLNDVSKYLSINKIKKVQLNKKQKQLKILFQLKNQLKFIYIIKKKMKLKINQIIQEKQNLKGIKINEKNELQLQKALINDQLQEFQDTESTFEIQLKTTIEKDKFQMKSIVKNMNNLNLKLIKLRNEKKNMKKQFLQTCLNKENFPLTLLIEKKKKQLNQLKKQHSKLQEKKKKLKKSFRLLGKETVKQVAGLLEQVKKQQEIVKNLELKKNNHKISLMKLNEEKQIQIMKKKKKINNLKNTKIKMNKLINKKIKSKIEYNNKKKNELKSILMEKSKLYEISINNTQEKKSLDEKATKIKSIKLDLIKLSDRLKEKNYEKEQLKNLLVQNLSDQVLETKKEYNMKLIELKSNINEKTKNLKIINDKKSKFLNLDQISPKIEKYFQEQFSQNDNNKTITQKKSNLLAHVHLVYKKISNTDFKTPLNSFLTVADNNSYNSVSNGKNLIITNEEDFNENDKDKDSSTFINNKEDLKIIEPILKNQLEIKKNEVLINNLKNQKLNYKFTQAFESVLNDFFINLLQGNFKNEFLDLPIFVVLKYLFRENYFMNLKFFSLKMFLKKLNKYLNFYKNDINFLLFLLTNIFQAIKILLKFLIMAINKKNLTKHFSIQKDFQIFNTSDSINLIKKFFNKNNNKDNDDINFNKRKEDYIYQLYLLLCEFLEKNIQYILNYYYELLNFQISNFLFNNKNIDKPKHNSNSNDNNNNQNTISTTTTNNNANKNEENNVTKKRKVQKQKASKLRKKKPARTKKRSFTFNFKSPLKRRNKNKNKNNKQNQNKNNNKNKNNNNNNKKNIKKNKNSIITNNNTNTNTNKTTTSNIKNQNINNDSDDNIISQHKQIQDKLLSTIITFFDQLIFFQKSNFVSNSLATCLIKHILYYFNILSSKKLFEMKKFCTVGQSVLIRNILNIIEEWLLSNNLLVLSSQFEFLNNCIRLLLINKAFFVNKPSSFAISQSFLPILNLNQIYQLIFNYTSDSFDPFPTSKEDLIQFEIYKNENITNKNHDHSTNNNNNDESDKKMKIINQRNKEKLNSNNTLYLQQTILFFDSEIEKIDNNNDFDHFFGSILQLCNLKI
ncbi:hypothetical protein M0812_25213 [Anaeramoeba flamelloides]|uniref:Dilute domain-containing protein n=1 Tax=Anaeramoeba flamelloides TaxID=1746091 RepID=A0AAV7YDP3_9EUKA|nr:hypothetical protein M0812_25213 [Anaeramoeba flamelloides]